MSVGRDPAAGFRGTGRPPPAFPTKQCDAGQEARRRGAPPQQRGDVGADERLNVLVDLVGRRGVAHPAGVGGIRIAAGEWQTTRHEFADLMDRGKVDIAQPDVGRVGGLTEAMKVCDMAAERGRQIIPHCWKTGISISASAHLAAVTPHCPYFEYLPAELTDSKLRQELVQDDLQLIDGKLAIPQKPGLGIEVNVDALKRFRQD